MTTSIVVNCSVSLAWCLSDETGEYAADVLHAMVESTAQVPSLWPLEMANGLLMAERRGRIAEADIMQALDIVQILPIEVDDATHSQALGATMSLGREFGLTAYDASYLELAMRLDIPLAATDRALVRAARASGTELWVRLSVGRRA